MNNISNSPILKTTFSDLYSAVSELINQPCQLDASQQQPVYQCRSVQTRESPFPAYVSRSVVDQNNAYSVNHPLNQYVVVPFQPETNFILTDDFVNFQFEELDSYLSTNSETNFISTDDLVGFQPEESGLYSGSNGTRNGTRSDELLLTQPNLYNFTHPPLQESSVNFSQQSSLPVTIVNLLKKDTQQQVTNETAGFKTPEPTASGEFLTMTVQKAANRAYSCDYNRAFRAEIASSGDKRKACQAGKVAGRAASKRVRESYASEESLTIMPMPRKYYERAYWRLYKRAYRVELAQSGDIEKARQAGRSAGQAERKRLATASVSGEFRAPGLSRQDEGLIIDPFELVSSCVNGQPSKGKKIKQ